VEVTLVIPVRDEESSVDALASSICRQVVAPSAVLFVDGGSTDRTVEILRRWADRNPSWRVVETGRATPGRGRNVGIEATSAPWIALADAGMILDEHWLARLIAAARADPDAGVVYGHVEPAHGGFVTRSAVLAYVAPPRLLEHGPVRDGSIACCLLRRDAWVRAGGFPDLRAAEDGIFMRKLVELGVHAAVAPEARVVWQLAPTLRSTFRRFRLYSRVNVDAGQQAYWHHGVARQWLAASPFLVAGLRRRWLVAVPVLALTVRAGRSVARRREGRSLSYVANPARLAGVGAVLLTCDLATFAGWIDAVRGRHRGPS
jgi:glycosyltransferase involved in cell wall biosynthesis